MPQNRQEHSKDKSQTATTQADRGLSEIRDHSAGQAKELAKQAEKGGNPVRLADIKDRHEALQKELDKRAKLPGNADWKPEIERARDALTTLDKQQLAVLKQTTKNAAHAFGAMERSVEDVQTGQQNDLEDLALHAPTAAAVQRLAEHQSQQNRDVEKCVKRLGDAVNQHQSVQANAMRDTDRELTEAALSNRQSSDEQLSRLDRMNGVLANAKRKSAELAKDFRGSLKNFQKEMQAIATRVSPKQLDHLKEELENTPLAKLDDRA